MSNYITPWLAPLLPIFFPGAGRMARGVLAMCIASFSTAGLAKARLAGEGSPSSPKVDMDPTNGTRDLPAMVIRVCGIKEAVRRESFRGWKRMERRGGEE